MTSALLSGHEIRELWRGIPIVDLQIGVRALHCLRNAGIENLYDLSQWAEVQLLRLPGFGEGSLNQLRTALRKHSLKMAHEPPPEASPLSVEARLDALEREMDLVLTELVKRRSGGDLS